ncbi:MAG: Rne/Rng family ribonuclease [Salinarimonas sp.]
MANKMLIDASHPEETRVVVVRGQRVEEFDFEAANRKQLRGNIYLAKVTRVEPSLQAAFIEYGGNRHGFLAFSEIHPDYYQIPTADRQALLEDEAAREKEKEKEEEKRPNRRRVKVKAAENGDDGVTDDGDGNNDGDDEDSVEQLGGDALEEMPERRGPRRQYKIQEVIKRRQILLVQVVKEERGNKGAALTTYLSLAGRYSVLMPNTARGGGISRKITNADDRKRLKAVAQELEVPEGMGVILRTAGASRTKAEVKRDFEYLMRAWENVREATLSSTAPSLVYEEGSLIKRVIRDLYNKDIDEVLVSGDEGYREAKDFMRMLMPSHAKAVKAYKDPTPLFAAFGVEAQLDAMFSNQVSLKSGGYLVINPTEALVSIDVNSGRSTREHNIEDTALKTNLEAADEVARQLRLRDLAGLIVIDFIDMDEKRNNRAVEKRLKDALKSDRARIQIGRISPFGLLEMSRQRMRTGVLESSSVVCPTCGGSGFVRATPSVALHVLRSVEETLLKGATHNITVRTHFAVAFYILNQKRASLRELEERFGVEISVIADETLHSTAPFAIDRGEPVTHAQPKGRAGMAAEPVTAVSTMEEADAEEADEEEAEREARGDEESGEGGEGGGKRRRRRRRRRGRGENGQQDGDSRADQQLGDSEDDDGGSDDAEPEHGEVGEPVAASGEEQADTGEGKRRRGRRGGRRNRRGQDENAGSEGAEAAFETDASPATVSIAITEGGAETEAVAAPKASAEEQAATEEPAAEEKPAARPRRTRKAPARKKAKADVTVDSGEATEQDEAGSEPASAEEAVAEQPAMIGRDTDAITASATPLAQTASEAQPAPEAVANGEETHVSDGSAAAEEEAKASPPPEPVTVVLTPPDPDRPKRAGWWSKAKTIITGQD